MRAASCWLQTSGEERKELREEALRQLSRHIQSGTEAFVVANVEVASLRAIQNAVAVEGLSHGPRSAGFIEERRNISVTRS